MTTHPQEYQQRPFHYRALTNAVWSECDGGAAIATSYTGGQKNVNKVIAHLGLCDLSTTARIGFKGKETLEWLSTSGVTLESVPNKAYPQKSGAICAVLAPGEAMLLSGFDKKGKPSTTTIMKKLRKSSDIDSGVRSYLMPRQETHFDFLITGAKSAEMFSKICGVNLHPDDFAVGSIAQTSVARSNAIIIRADCGDTLAYRLLGDSASSLYMWQVMLDAGEEFNIQAVGFGDIQSSYSKA